MTSYWQRLCCMTLYLWAETVTFSSRWQPNFSNLLIRDAKKSSSSIQNLSKLCMFCASFLGWGWSPLNVWKSQDPSRTLCTEMSILFHQQTAPSLWIQSDSFTPEISSTTLWMIAILLDDCSKTKEWRISLWWLVIWYLVQKLFATPEKIVRATYPSRPKIFAIPFPK